MSNPEEGYAFITNQGWFDHLSDMYPDAIEVGDSYRMIQYCMKDEQGLIDLSDSLGFEAKRFSSQNTITSMELGSLGPFIVYGDDVHTVVDHFNQAEES
jgi:hypothetical protein